MTKTEFYKIVRATPRYVPVFRFRKVPEWFKAHHVEVGDLGYYDRFGSLVLLKTGHRYSLEDRELRALEFVGYRAIGERDICERW